MAIPDAPPLEAAPRKEGRERELVERIRSGNEQAFEELVRLHERRVLGTAVQMGLAPADAQDACQEVFLRVFRYLGGFRLGYNFEGWLWRIVVNVVYDFLKKRRDRSEISWSGVLGKEEEVADFTAGLHITVENVDLCEKLLSRMAVLTEQERMAFVLRDLQDMETADVARAMRISKVTVRRHATSARKKLRQVLSKLSKKTEGESSDF
jgi:RNA polymerase sigma-70 factor, ECF subfamily